MGIKRKFKRLFFKMKLRNMLLISGVLLAVFFLLVQSFLFYSIGANLVQSQLDELDQSTMQQVVNRSALTVEEMERFTTNLAEHSGLQELLQHYLAADDQDVLLRGTLQKEIQEFLMSSATFYSQIYRIDIYIQNDLLSSMRNIPYISTDVESSQVYAHAMQSESRLVALETSLFDIREIQSEADFVFVTLIPYSNSASPALMVVEMEHGWFESMTSSALPLVVLNHNRELVWTNFEQLNVNAEWMKQFSDERQGEMYEQIAGRAYKIQYQYLENPGWFLVVLKDLDQTYQPLAELRRNVLIAMTISFVISFLFSAQISRRVAFPVYKLMAIAKRFDRPRIEPWGGARLRRSFRDIVLFYYIIVVTVPLISYGMVYYFTVTKVLSHTTEETYKLNTQQTADNIHYFLEINHRLGSNLAFYPTVQDWLKNPQEVTEEQIQEVLRLLDSSTGYLDLPAEVHIYNQQGESIAANVVHTRTIDVNALSMMQDDARTKRIWIGERMNRQGRPSIEFYFKISDLENLRPIGYVSFTYTEKSIQSLYKDIATAGSLVELYTTDNKIISSTDTMRISESSMLSDDKGLIYFNEQLGDKGWYLHAIYPSKELNVNNNRLLIWNIIFFLSSLLCVMWLSYRISEVVSNTFDRMEQSIVQWEAFQPAPNFSRGVWINEIEQLGRTFNRMASKIGHLTKDMYETQLQQAEAVKESKEMELHALQAQINPHFLFNTLETLKWMVIGDEKLEAAEAIENLGDLFRLGVSEGQSLVSLMDEIKYSQLYVDLQKLRFGDRLEVCWHIEPSLVEQRVVKLLLQPILENAIHYGMSDKVTNLKIAVKAIEDGGNIQIEIEDNGGGMKPERLEEVRKLINGTLNSEHIGLRNVNRRIQLQFGEGYGLELYSEWGKGTRVIVNLPIR